MTIHESHNRPRSEITVCEGSRHASHRLTVTRQGIEVDAWYDSFVGTGETIYLSWAQVEALKERVERKRPHNTFDPKEVYLQFNGEEIAPAQEEGS